MADAKAKRSDLGVRTLSAAVMLAVAGTALWLGGMVWALFVLAIATGVLWEWQRLTAAFVVGSGARALWSLAGMIYVGVAAAMLLFLRNQGASVVPVLAVVGMVIGTDVGAYFAGRTFGGPKIAPAISPSKTWSGLIGGMAGASLVLALVARTGCEASVSGGAGGLLCATDQTTAGLPLFLALGMAAAVVAQIGDFFESWMKRRAGVKDSSNLIPGHGGLFDRADGMLAVLFALAVLIVLGGLL